MGAVTLKFVDTVFPWYVTLTVYLPKKVDEVTTLIFAILQVPDDAGLV